MDPELTEEEKRETILANEDDYLEGLLQQLMMQQTTPRRSISSVMNYLWNVQGTT